MNMPQLIGSVTVGERGQVVIPADARESMSIKTSDKLLVFKAPVDGVLIVAKPETFEELLSRFELNLNIESQANTHE